VEVKQSTEAGVKTPASMHVVDMISGIVEPPTAHPLPKQESVSLVHAEAEARDLKKAAEPETLDLIGRA
jgi:hypothetical protein